MHNAFLHNLFDKKKNCFLKTKIEDIFHHDKDPRDKMKLIPPNPRRNKINVVAGIGIVRELGQYF